jgi:hypothetical protein
VQLRLFVMLDINLEILLHQLLTILNIVATKVLKRHLIRRIVLLVRIDIKLINGVKLPILMKLNKLKQLLQKPEYVKFAVLRKDIEKLHNLNIDDPLHKLLLIFNFLTNILKK